MHFRGDVGPAAFAEAFQSLVICNRKNSRNDSGCDAQFSETLNIFKILFVVEKKLGDDKICARLDLFL